MTLTQFLSATIAVREVDLRRALVQALVSGAPRTRPSYARFYRRVLEALVAAGALPHVA